MVTLSVGKLTGSSSADVVLEIQEYKNSTTCAAANLENRVSFSGVLTATTQTKLIDINKAIRGGPSSLGGYVTGTASVADFTLGALTIASGSFPPATIPAIGAKTQVGYMLKGKSLYVLENPKGEADGLGGYFSRVVLTKQ